MPPKLGQDPRQVLDARGSQAQPELVVHAEFERFIEKTNAVKHVSTQKYRGLGQVVTPPEQSLELIRSGPLAPEEVAPRIDDVAVAIDHVALGRPIKLLHYAGERPGQVPVIGIQPRHDLAIRAAQAFI